MYLVSTEPNLEVSHGLRKPHFSYKNSELVILLVENVAPTYLKSKEIAKMIRYTGIPYAYTLN